MATPSAAVVFQGRDNTGAAAIVDSTQDTSFMDNMLQNIAKDAMTRRKAQQQAKEDLRRDIEELQYDPLGQEPLDLEGESLVKAAEDYAVEAYKRGKDPMDMTTDEGREFLKLKRKAQMNAIRGKGAVNYYNLAMKGAGNEDVDQKRLNAWMKGYQDVKPNEGETLAMALNRYVEQNPYAPMKPVGAYDFVKPILPNIGRDKNGLVSELNKDNVMGIMNQQLATQEGQNMAKRMMEEAGLDFDSPDDVKKFLDQQYLLIQGKNPRQQNQGRSSSRGDSGNGSKGPTYEVTYSDSKEMMQDGNSNAIQLKDLPAVPIKLENGGLEVGTPIAIVKRKDGQLYLEYQADRDGEMGPYYVPYRMHRDAIETIYKRDIAEDLTKGTAKSEGSEKSKTSGKKQIKRSDIAAKAKAAGYSEAEYTKQLKKNNIEIID